MVMAYRETPEERALTSPFQMYSGQKTDIRWSGGWLTPEGKYHPVDYKNGITHETIANEHVTRASEPPVSKVAALVC